MRLYNLPTVAALLAALLGCVSQDGELPTDMRGVTWKWTSLTTPAETITVGDPASYTIAFVAENRVHLRADCNRGSGQYTVRTDGRIAFGPIALTRMACPPGSLSDRFVRDVESAESYALTNKSLLLALPRGAGNMRFERVE